MYDFFLRFLPFSSAWLFFSRKPIRPQASFVRSPSYKSVDLSVPFVLPSITSDCSSRPPSPFLIPFSVLHCYVLRMTLIRLYYRLNLSSRTLSNCDLILRLELNSLNAFSSSPDYFSLEILLINFVHFLENKKTISGLPFGVARIFKNKSRSVEISSTNQKSFFPAARRNAN